ncbi:hypothetical protein [Bradyrhizobium betae]|uniref:Uncharacterized protein n=1 Tax=Bradyrhizobium betae TaxID=244734 RepID=A0A5P6P8M7_9BRAD|nr:hypothetical protein [Bradyrhizobium betae]MCS3727368.1 hypothetical protein [Bradyrhizobium betae]QFI74739.1 hypothetical protein F8237_21410 [Bradyrhizobium betae]
MAMSPRNPDESDDEYVARLAAELPPKPGIEIIVAFDPGPDDLILANIRLAPDGTVRAWQVVGEGGEIEFKANPVPDWEKLGLFATVELLAKMCGAVQESDR